MSIIMFLTYVLAMMFSIGTVGVALIALAEGFGICLCYRRIAKAIDGLESKILKVEQEFKTSQTPSPESSEIQSIDA